jgi:hypothetical protein
MVGCLDILKSKYSLEIGSTRHSLLSSNLYLYDAVIGLLNTMIFLLFAETAGQAKIFDELEVCISGLISDMCSFIDANNDLGLGYKNVQSFPSNSLNAFGDQYTVIESFMYTSYTRDKDKSTTTYLLDI